MERFYTTDQVAKFCNVSRGSVVRWIREGKLKAAVTMGGHHRIFDEDIVELLKSLGFPVPAAIDLTQPKSLVKALIVEDEESMRRLLRVFLKQHFPNFQIDEAVDGFEAGLKIQRSRPDLVLLDIWLPGQDGIAVCKLIRRIPELAHITIIAMTGVCDESLRERALEAGVNHFLWKPYELDELRDLIEKKLKIASSFQKDDKSGENLSNAA